MNSQQQQKNIFLTMRLAAFFPILATALAMSVLSATAAQTDLSTRPLNNGSAAQIKPNIMLLLDTSNSMKRTHMPDELETTAAVQSLGYKAFQCNVLYYNPAQNYLIPKNADGTSFPVPTFTSAKYNGFDTASANVNLSTSFRAYDNSTRQTGAGEDPAQAAYYYLHSSGQTLPIAAAPCTDVDTNASKVATTSAGGIAGNWQRVLVSSTSGPGATDERQNFAVWYTYYRTRLNLTKSAISLAFAPLTDSYRVGFITARPGSPVNSSAYLEINDFNSTQRTDWFNKLFSQQPAGSSPMREGLARVGRHYGGKQDGINQGMTGDPFQYSCQQNFTIATTDGYWNTGAETVGPVQLDGTTLVGQQDNILTDNSGNTPRPMWDGTNEFIRVITDKNNQYSYGPCVGGWFNLSTLRNDQSTYQLRRSTSQINQSTIRNLQTSSQRLRRTTQNLAITEQVTQSTAQIRQSTQQSLQSTVQNFRVTEQNTSSTIQRFRTTNQNRQSTNQNLQSTSRIERVTTQFLRTTQQVSRSTVQNLRSTTQDLQRTEQRRQSTTQTRIATSRNLQSVVQLTQSTSQLTRSTAQRLQSTVQNRQSTVQMRQSTAQTTLSTSQVTRSTSNASRSTSQLTRSTSQLRQSTSRTDRCFDEVCTPAATCTAGSGVTCQTTTTGPTLVSSCTNASANSSNGFVNTTCADTTTGPTGVASCSNVAPDASNSFVRTTCNTVMTGPSAVATCTAAVAGASNSYIATTCGTINAGPTAVASCSPSGADSSNGFTTTTCNTVTTGPTGVAPMTCVASSANSSNAFTTTTCANPTTGPVGVASCTASGANGGNNYIATTCTPNNTTNVAVASCTASGPDSSNGFTTTTCPAPITTLPTGVQICTPATANSGNSFVTTTCVDNNTGPTGVASCMPVTASMSNSWQAITCFTATTGPVGVASCNPVAAGPGNSYVETTCGNNNSSNVAVQVCTPAMPSPGNGYATVTCTNPTTGPTPIASCSPITATSGNSWITTTCPNVVTTNVGVASCTPSASTSPLFTLTTCNDNNSANVGVQTCTPIVASMSNSFTATICTPNPTGPTDVETCVPSGETSSNQWVTTTCATNNTTNVPVATCTASGPNSGNSFTTTTCVGPTVLTGPTPFDPVACAASAGVGPGPAFIATVCTNTTATAPVGMCVAQTENAGNNWTRIVCNTITTNLVPVVSCTPSGPTSLNNFTTTTCPLPIVTTNQPVGICTATGANSGNNFTSVTCDPPVTSGPTAVPTCTPQAANSGNTFTSTSCANTTTGPTGVATCVPIAPSGLNAQTETTCGTNNTPSTAVASCTPSGPTSLNGFTTTTCPTPVTTSNVPVQTCTAAAAGPGNTFTTTTCTSPNNTTNVPVATCTASGPTAGNSWVTTTCNTATTGPTGVASCTPVPASGINSFTATTCGANNSGTPDDPGTPQDERAIPVQTCTPSGPTLMNSYVTTTCPPPATTGPDPVSSCSGGNAAQIASAGNSWLTRTCGTTNPADVATNYVARPVVGCTAQMPASSNSFVTISCPAPITTGPTPVASCTPILADSLNTFTATNCNTVTSGPTPIAACTVESANSMNNFTAATCDSVASGPTPVAICTPAVAGSSNSFTQTTCQAVTTGPFLTQTCTAAGASGANSFTQTLCPAVPAQKIQYVTTTTESSTPFSGGIATAAPTIVTTMSALADVDTVCYTPGVNPAPALPSPGKPGTTWLNGMNDNITLLPVPTAPCLTWPCTATNILGGSVGNTLADVAQYYYVTDLRPSLVDDVVSAGNGAEDDRVKHQHMTTFAIGLGVSGELKYRADYRNASTITGDFADLRTGAKNWPLPAADQPSSIDDFWHAAVNGRGQYFSAGNPTSVIEGLTSALAGVTARAGSGSAAASSSSGDIVTGSIAYQAKYVSQDWTGDLQRFTRDPTTGAIGGVPTWEARLLLDAKVGNACDNRNIYIFRNSTATKLAPFTWNTSTCDGSGNPNSAGQTDLTAAEQAYFGASNVNLLSHFPLMTDGSGGTVNQRAAAAGANLLNFIRGHRGREGFEPNVLTKLYRTRKHVLGDIVSSQPSYAKSDTAAEYSDAGFAEYNTNNESRIGMVYVGSNGGMLHAFRAGESVSDALGGKEQWSYVPTAVIPNLYRLADNNYANSHVYSVDGPPTVFSASVTNAPSGASDWKTVLVAGLRGGGKGYYAIDVTDPINPKALWEFNWGPTCISGVPSVSARTDCHLGYTYGAPSFGKLADGTWVVFLSSGYNNVNSPTEAGDGVGYLYVVNAFTGQIIRKISTGVGNATSPSGLAPISTYADDPVKNAYVLHVYGGDLEGNIWRFDAASNFAVTRVGTATDGTSAQAITTVMPTRETNGKVQVIAGTGRLLGLSDIPRTQTQSIYSIVDQNTPIADLRAALTKIELSASGVAPARVVTAVCNGSGDACEARKGWYADFPGVGERIVVDMKLFGRTILAASSILDSNPCNAGGTSQLYAFSALNGLSPFTPRDAPPGTSSTVSDTSAAGLAAGISFARVNGQESAGLALTRIGEKFGGRLFQPQKPIGNRVTWRELTQ